MDYRWHYDKLLSRARSRVVDGYVERHHATPRCLGGGEEIGNLVILTPEEHLIAHLLLVKMYPGNHKLVYAANMMTLNANGMRPNNNKEIGWLRRRFAEASRAIGTGKHPSPESCARMSAAHKGVKKSPKHIAAMSAVRMGRQGVRLGAVTSLETREKQREAALKKEWADVDRYRFKNMNAAMTHEQRSQKAHKAWATKWAKATVISQAIQQEK